MDHPLPDGIALPDENTRPDFSGVDDIADKSPTTVSDAPRLMDRPAAFFENLVPKTTEAATKATVGQSEGGKGGEGGGELAPSTGTHTVLTLAPTGAPEGGEAGEGGDSAPFTAFAAIQPTNAEFLAAIFPDLPDGARIVVTGLDGNPKSGGWVAHDSSQIEDVCRSNRNTYFNCASFWPATDGTLAARKDCAAAYHVLVLDDVGTKVDRSLIGGITPSWELETSPGNFQLGFKLTPPLDSAAKVDRFQHIVAAAGLTDKGAMGIARWARLPNGINGKPMYEVDGKPFTCRLHGWNPQIAYEASQLQELLAPAVESVSVPRTKGSARPRAQGDGEIDSKVYTPRAGENPVVAAFKTQGLYKREISAGKHDVTCPWTDEHTDALDSGAAYFEPDDLFPIGGFCCQHSHKDNYLIGQVLEHFGLTTADARNKTIIRAVAGEMKAIVMAAEEVLAQRGDLYQAGSLIVTAGRDPISGDATLVPLSESALTLALSDACDWQRYDKRSHAWERCDPLPRHVSLIYKAQSYSRLPPLLGLARQPYYREQDDQLVRTAGYDPVSQRLGLFDATKFPPMETTREEAEKELAQLEELLCEFHFAAPVDKAAALSAIFTAVTRPALGLAPAFHVSAPSSGSGKSFLCETISLFAGPGSPARMSYPKTSEEASKAILSVLLTGPAVIEFDDMDTDWLPHGVINRMLTSRSITDRILGVSKVATVRTEALVMGSGNNVGPLRDLARRVLTINLNARTEAPGTLVYKGNPIAALKANRERYVSAVLTIIEAWKAAGRPKAAVPSIASYGGKWSDLCRHPLLWLGQADPATALLEQMLSDPDADTLLRLLTEWHASHGNKALTLRRLMEDSQSTDLHEALHDLPVVERGAINRSRLGHYFKRNANRIVGGFILEKVPNSERTAWRVVRADGNPPPSPSSPPSPKPPGATGQPDELF